MGREHGDKSHNPQRTQERAWEILGGKDGTRVTRGQIDDLIAASYAVAQREAGFQRPMASYASIVGEVHSGHTATAKKEPTLNEDLLQKAATDNSPEGVNAKITWLKQRRQRVQGRLEGIDPYARRRPANELARIEELHRQDRALSIAIQLLQQELRSQGHPIDEDAPLFSFTRNRRGFNY